MAVPYNKNSGKKMMYFELVQIRKNIKLKLIYFGVSNGKEKAKAKWPSSLSLNF